MTARIGYLSALASGPGGAAELSPPRRLFPMAGFLDTEDGFRQAPPGLADLPGPPSRRAAGPPDLEPQLPSWPEAVGYVPGRPEAGTAGRWLSAAPMAAEPARADGPAAEPVRADGPGAEPAEDHRTADRTPAPPHRARPATGRSGSPGALPGHAPSDKEPAHPSARRAGEGPGELLPPAATGPAPETGQHASAAMDGLGSGTLPAQPPFVPVAHVPGAAPGPQPGRQVSRGGRASSPAPDQGQEPGAGPGNVGQSAPEAEPAKTNVEYPGAAVLRDYLRLPAERAEFTDPAAGGPRRSQRTASEGLDGATTGFPGAAVQHAAGRLSAGHVAVPGQQAERAAAEAAREDGGTLRPAHTAAAAPDANSETPRRFPAAAQPPDQAGPHAAELRPQAAELRPQRQVRAPAAAPAAPASASTPRPTLSIGTIEVTLLPSVHDHVPAGPPRGEPAHPPERLSRGLGPHFGQGQT